MASLEVCEPPACFKRVPHVFPRTWRAASGAVNSVLLAFYVANFIFLIKRRNVYPLSGHKTPILATCVVCCCCASIAHMTTTLNGPARTPCFPIGMLTGIFYLNGSLLLARALRAWHKMRTQRKLLKSGMASTKTTNRIVYGFIAGYAVIQLALLAATLPNGTGCIFGGVNHAIFGSLLILSNLSALLIVCRLKVGFGLRGQLMVVSVFTIAASIFNSTVRTPLLNAVTANDPSIGFLVEFALSFQLNFVSLLYFLPQITYPIVLSYRLGGKRYRQSVRPVDKELALADPDSDSEDDGSAVRSRGLLVLLEEGDSRTSRQYAQHCALEFSMENLLFWRAVQSFHAAAPGYSPTRMKQAASDIVSMYISDDARMQVNLPDGTRQQLLRAVHPDNEADVPPTLFDEAQDIIYRLMERDSFSRFLSTRFESFTESPSTVVPK